MKFYYVDGEYFSNAEEAKRSARHIAQNSYHDVEVHRTRVANDIPNLLRLLNSLGGHTEYVQVIYIAKAKLKPGALRIPKLQPAH